jgi:ATP-binding cassette subfamily B protein
LNDDLRAALWPLDRLGDALEALARRTSLSPEPAELLKPPEALLTDGPEAVGRWLQATASALGIEAEPVEAAYGEALSLVKGAAPALLLVQDGPGPCVLALQRGGRRFVLVLAPDGTVRRFPPEHVRAALCRDIEAADVEEVDRLLESAAVVARRRPRAREAILRERLSSRRIGGCWLVRAAPGASLWGRIRREGLVRPLATFAVGHAAQHLLWLASWAVVGRAVLLGRIDPGWLAAWVLLLLSLVPMRVFVTSAEGKLAIGAGGLLKQRLLHGALRLDPDAIRHQGAGQLLGRVLEADALEALALNGGFLTLTAAVEIVLAALVLAAGAGGLLHAVLLVAWAAAVVMLGLHYLRSRDRWTEARLRMTHDLVERMIGHRTRLAQEPPASAHEEEDQAVARYLPLSEDMDRRAARMMVLPSRGWLLIGFLGLAPAFIAGGSQTALAVAVGGVLSAYLALSRLAVACTHLAAAWIGWKTIGPLARSSGRSDDSSQPGIPLSALALGPPAQGEPILVAQDLTFRYRPDGEPVLRGVRLKIHAGDRMLLQGPSGGGKSTLASLLSGMRSPSSGLLLLHGLDRATLGLSGFRRRVAFAPQFHENYLLAETLAFNLLMGRGWPPTGRDLREAERICRALGLGDVIDRMPGGMLQMVGENGWQLSHGERSRVYIARALLQGADLLMLDESFAALDPETLRLAFRAVLERAKTVLIIAHR